jgi:hypothetical protein
LRPTNQFGLATPDLEYDSSDFRSNGYIFLIFALNTKIIKLKITKLHVSLTNTDNKKLEIIVIKGLGNPM